ncbi:methionine--tRNA ligase [Sulfodiicoccus acidiphilus]|uniref:Methionine--tRNA ligase n=1 Tax=Sulfodiicoccus acidiphilus TaxID=1670455 RepID=A0A348B0S5_9CREN|nr:methionine--tRNA ligase [Sulfodiicoccus acidiphilus]BBD71777.1 methionine--tRNA ligase [Sulfodiicoccus acidiphilus]GGT99141.1 methionine--tRNA ligase [Sulfodiicoccus acidiphilus]
MKVLVASAWPYVNAVPHLGNLVGSHLSADVFARYARLRYGKENVVFVSGSDEHGTPIEVEAIRRKTSPRELTDQAHDYDVKLFDGWELSFDNYSRTESPVHKRFVSDFLMGLRDYLEVKEEEIPYCEVDRIYLPDRFVKGTCPYCGFEDARGDQCDNCGRLLSPELLKDPRCSICSSKPVWKRTVHWFFNLERLEEDLKSWLERAKFPKNVEAVAMSWVTEGLRPRSLTRDNSWGIPAPFPGAEGKTIYVWFEALLGYLSATVEFFERKGKKEEWLNFWKGQDVRSYYFMGKDNIPFHAVILPAMLLASKKGYSLPYMIAASEYLLYEGQKFSKSRKVGIWIDEALEIMDVEYWRYLLIRLRPEERDMNFAWKEAIRIINTELNNDLGNYINRVLSMIKRSFNSVVPQISNPSQNDLNFRAFMEEVVVEVSKKYDDAKLKGALESTLQLAREGNQYLNRASPWDAIAKGRMEEAGTVLTIAVNSIRTLGILLYPVMPTHMNYLYSMLNLGKVEDDVWDSAGKLTIKPGHKIGEVRTLFKKLPDDFEKEVEEKLKDARRKIEAVRPPLLR